MKLHLPKLLRHAVLACFAAVSGIAPTVGTATLAGAALMAVASQASAMEVSIASTDKAMKLTESWTISALNGSSYSDVSYDAETGVLTGFSGKNGLKLTMSTTWDTAGYLARAGNPGDSETGHFGLNLRDDGTITGRWQGADWTDGGTIAADTLPALGETADLTLILSNSEGVYLKNGEEQLYGASNLKSSTSSDTNIYLNKDVISALTFTVEGDATYTSNDVSVVKAAGTHENVTGGEVMYTGGESGTGVAISEAGNDIFVGGAGLLFLQTLNTGSIELDNDIYVGGSTHANVATRGVVEFGNADAAGHTTTLNGTIHVLEDTTFSSRGAADININGALTDKKNIDGSASTGGKTLTMKGEGYSLAGNVSLGGLSLVSGGVTLNGATNTLGTLSVDATSILTVGSSATLSVTDGANISNSIINEGTLSLNGALTVDSLREIDFEYNGGSDLTYGTHGFRSGTAEYQIVVGGGSAALDLGSDFSMVVGGTTYSADDYKVENGGLVLTIGGADTIYEILSGCEETVVYDATSENVTTAATGIRMEGGTKLAISGETSRLTEGVTIAGEGVSITVNNGASLNILNTLKFEEGATVGYILDGGSLVMSNAQVADSISMNNGATLVMNNGASLNCGSIALSGGSLINLRNGNGGQILNSDITVSGTGYISGSMNGNNTNVQGTITGNGVLGLIKDQQWSNAWTVSALIQDATDGALKVQVGGGHISEGSIVATGENKVTLSGANTYSGGTEILGGTVTTTSAQALGTGAVTVTGGTLAINSNLVLGSTLTVGAEGTVTVSQTGSIVLGSLEGFTLLSGTVPTENGLASMQYQIIDAASGATVQKQTGAESFEALTTVIYSGGEQTLTDGVLNLSGVYYVIKDTVEYGTIAESAAESVTIQSAGTLKITNTDTTSLALSNSGTINLLGGCKEGSSLNVANTADGVLNVMTSTGADTIVSMGGAFTADSLSFTVTDDTKTATYVHVADKSYSGELTVHEGGTLNISSTNLNNAGVTVDGGTLVLGGSGLALDVAVENGGKLTVANTDALNWNGGSNISILDGTLEMGNKRLSLQNVVISLTNSTVTGTGDTNAALDYIENARTTLNASGTSVIEGTVRLRGGAVLSLVVDGEDSSLSVGTITGPGRITKSGAGVLGLVNTTGTGITIEEGTFALTGSAGYTGAATVNADGTFQIDTTAESVDITGSIAGSGTLLKSNEGAATLNTLAAAWTGDVSVTGGTLNLGAMGGTSAVDVAAGTLNVTGDVACDVTNSGTLSATGTLSGAVTNSGALTAASISGASLTSTGGSIELTGEGAAISATEISISGTTLKGTWSAEAAELGTGVVVDTTGTVTLTGADLGGQISVTAGTLALTGETTMSGFTATERSTYVDSTNNGFADLAAVYAGAVSVSGEGTVDTTGLTIDGYSATLESDGSLVANLGVGTEYWVTSGTVDYNGELVLTNSAGAAATGFVLNGGELTIGKELGSLGIKVESTGGSITVLAGQTLKESSISGEGTAQLGGNGSYDIDSALVLGSNVALSDTWAGTVKTSATEVAADTQLTLGGKVEFTADKLTLGGDLSTAGELVLGSELAFGSFDSMLSADTLTLRGDALAIGLDTSALQDATKIDTQLIALGNNCASVLTYGGQEITAAGIPVLEGIGKDGLYDATLAWDGSSLVLSTTLREGVLVWDGETSDFGENQIWDSSVSGEGTDVAFVGGGSGTVEISGSATANNIVISNHGDDASVQDYTFIGDDVEAKGDLSVNYGTSLTVSNTTTVAGSATVNAGSALNVSEGELNVKGNITSGDGSIAEGGSVAVEDGQLSVGGSMTAGSISVAEKGTLVVSSDVKASSLVNASTVEAGNVTVTSLVNTGDFSAKGIVLASAPKASSADKPVALGASGEIQNSGNMTVGGVDASSFVMTGGTLEITTEAGFSSANTEITGGVLKADTVAWGIDGGNISGVTIEGTETISLSNANLGTVTNNGSLELSDVTLSTALTNNGDMVLNGTIDISALECKDESVYTDLDGSLGADGNGYTAQTSLYTVVEGEGTSIADGVVWNSGDADAVYVYNDGLLTEKKSFSKDTYYVNSSMTYDADAAGAMGDNETSDIIVNGGQMNISAAVAQKLTIKGGEVNANAAIAEQVALEGGTLNLNSTVENGIAADSGTINIGSAAKGDVAVTGKQVNINGGSVAVDLLLSDVKATLNVQDTTVYAQDAKVTLNGTLTDGELIVKQSAAAKGDLNLQDSMLVVVIDSDSVKMSTKDVQAIMENGIVDLGNMSGDAEVFVGTYDATDDSYKASEGYTKYFSDIILEDGKVIAVGRNASYYTDKAAESVSANGGAGLVLADAALVELNPQMTKGSALGAVLNKLDKADAATEDELGAALAGASTAVLGMAVHGDVERQLKAIRNRTTTMGVPQDIDDSEMPYFNAWINAEGDFSELADNGTEGGYQLNSWGGTVGFDADLSSTFTAGLALTAMYGDIDATGADKATGDIDTYYLTAFARYAPSAWTHTFVGTIGKSDISMDRTIEGYENKGETDGMSFGLMYEVGRVYALDEYGVACLQPVFNITWKHTSVSAYTEQGSDAALDVDDQTLDTVTLGLGARAQAVVGESVYNRTSILEARVLAKVDVGDRQGSADVALAALPETRTSVDSAEMGAFGLEAGAGLTVPVGQEGGSIFADASVELRSDYINVNGTVGYRVNF